MELYLEHFHYLVIFKLISYFLKGLGSKNSENTQKAFDPKILEEKLNLHEMILRKKLKNALVNKELKEKRENINEIIENKKIKNDKDVNKLLINTILNDEEVEKIKREKAEKEFYKLVEDIKEIEEEVKIFIKLFNHYRKGI